MRDTRSRPDLSRSAAAVARHVARPFAGLAVLLTVLLLAPAAADAQYFGRNKVQYDRLDFRVLHTPHFEVFHYPPADSAALDAARMAERWRARLGLLFNFELPARNPIILYADHPDFQQTNVIDAVLGQSTGGVTESLRNRVVMPFTGLDAEFDHVLGHELVHAYQYAIAEADSVAGLGGLVRLPLWFTEGMAEYLSLGRMDAFTAMFLRDALARDELPALRDLGRDPRYFPYRFGHAFWAFVGGTYGDETIRDLYREALRRDWERAIREVLEIEPVMLEQTWHHAIRGAYAASLERRTPAAEVGTRLVAPTGPAGAGAGGLNLGPAISPDGRRIAFFSDRGVFGMDLYVVATEPGAEPRRIWEQATNPRFDALSFTGGAGAWSPDGGLLAVVALHGGRHELALLDLDRGEVARSVRVPGVPALADPAWSPDGRRIAFSGMVGGRSDLFVHDLETGETQRLTDDAHAALQPAWSPDGRTLAFVSDRGAGTDLAALRFAAPAIFLVDVASGEVGPAAGFTGAHHSNPAFAPDGDALFFLADPNGYNDIYRLELATGEIGRVTRVATGVYGLSPRARALDVAADAGTLVFTVFDGGGYGIHLLEGDAAAAALPAQPAVCRFEPPASPRTCGAPALASSRIRPRAAVLPPVDVPPGAVDAYLASPMGGLADASDFVVRSYRPRLRFDGAAPMEVGVLVGPFGTGMGGEAAFFFSDMLGNHRLGIAARVDGSLRDTGFEAAYFDLRGRWNRGIGFAHVPFTTGWIQPVLLPDGSTGLAGVRERTVFRQVTGLGAYPFSATRRLELSLTYSRLSVEREIWTTTLNRSGRQSQSENEVPGSTYDRVTAAFQTVQPAIALVEDRSVFGMASPAQGVRWRVEAQPSFGDFRLVTLLGDYRRYSWRRPVTLAVRGVHLGRYGRDAESPALSALFLGADGLVRGYAAHTLDGRECAADAVAFNSCPVFDRLLGSRMALANLEVRLPLFGFPGYGLVDFPLPVELAGFVDAGAAWNSDERPVMRLTTTSPDRTPIFSAGLAGRVRLADLVIEVHYVNPFQRPEKGAHWGFRLSPGW